MHASRKWLWNLKRRCFFNYLILTNDNLVESIRTIYNENIWSWNWRYFSNSYFCLWIIICKLKFSLQVKLHFLHLIFTQSGLFKNDGLYLKNVRNLLIVRVWFSRLNLSPRPPNSYLNGICLLLVMKLTHLNTNLSVSILCHISIFQDQFPWPWGYTTVWLTRQQSEFHNLISETQNWYFIYLGIN